MSEEKKPGFDAESFLANYPTGSPGTRKSKKQPETPPPEPQEIEPIPPKQVARETISTSSVEYLSDKEAAYKRDFIEARAPIGFSKSTKHVGISETYHNKINMILAATGKSNTIGGYIDNVLKKHFEDLTPVIIGLLDKNRQF